MNISNIKTIKDLIIASGPVIIENNMVLLDKKHDSNIWMFPGGRMMDSDFMNTDPIVLLENVCMRRCKEEINVKVNIISSLKTIIVPRPDVSNSWALLVHWLAKKEGEPKPGPDIAEIRQFSILKIISGEYTETFAPNILPVLKSYLDQNQS